MPEIEEGNRNTDDDHERQEAIMCPFFDECTSKRKNGYKDSELLRKHLNKSHGHELDRLSMEFLDVMKQLPLPRALCSVCKLLQPFKSLHKCIDGQKIRISDLDNSSQESSQAATALASMLENLHINDELSSWNAFANISWKSIASFTVPLLKEVPYNFRLAINHCWKIVTDTIIENGNNENACLEMSFSSSMPSTI
jgi:hypothetical protein